MVNADIKKIMQTLNNFSAKDQKKIINQIMDLMGSNNKTEKPNCNTMVKEYTFKNEKPNCPHCKAQANLGSVIKKGFKNGVQRFYCKSCNHFFVATTNTAFQKTRKSPEVWERFIQLTISGESLKTCAEECNLAHQTAFTWRHKILNAFRVHQESIMLSGKVELDEMFIPISYKGNHIKGSVYDDRRRLRGMDNNLPRESLKRGSDNKPISSKERACVCCMVKNGSEGFYAVVPGVGYMQPAMLDKTVGKHVDKANTLMLVDQYKITKNYLENNNYNFMSLLSNTSDNAHEHKPEIKDGNHLQHVNAFHRHLRHFLSNYYGVSTKYLENYVSLYIWLKNIAAIKQKRQQKKVSISRTATADCYITRKGLEALPAVPVCA